MSSSELQQIINESSLKAQQREAIYAGVIGAVGAALGITGILTGHFFGFGAGFARQVILITAIVGGFETLRVTRINPYTRLLLMVFIAAGLTSYVLLQYPAHIERIALISLVLLFGGTLVNLSVQRKATLKNGTGDLGMHLSMGFVASLTGLAMVALQYLH